MAFKQTQKSGFFFLGKACYSQTMSRPLALVVDDEPDLVEILTFAAEDEGYRTLSAQNGSEAAKILAEEAVDLVISDMRMPGGDGLLVLEAVENLAQKPTVVLVSGFSDMTPEQAKARGAILLPKPIDFEALGDIFREVAKAKGS